jgi:3-phosphoshikimate 1-carboxyvinyltransferase
LTGKIQVPGDKSIGHRALLFSLLCSEPVRITGLGDGADNGRSARAIARLGARVSREGDQVVVVGTGLTLSAPTEAIDCGNSGTTIRLLCGLLAGQGFATTLIGDESLSRRPMGRVAVPLRLMGAQITGSGDHGLLVAPLTVGPAPGPLIGIEYLMPVASAQVKSAVVLAGLFADGKTVVIEPGPSRDHSERLLAHLGAPITASGKRVEVDPAGWDRRLRGGHIIVPGDPSSSAFWLVAALITGSGGLDLPGVCVNPTRVGFVDVLRAMGARVALDNLRQAGGEPVADLRVEAGDACALAGCDIGADLAVRCIDEIPILAVAAARARGITHIRDAAELRVKESDRIDTTCAMLRAFGIEVETFEDGLIIRGRPDRPLRAAEVDAAGDHRIAMAAAIAALVAEGPTRIDDVDNVATSYPGFVAALQLLGGEIKVES